MILCYALILLFTCAAGCGSPSQVTMTQRYDKLSQCQKAGDQWLKPGSNPQKAVRTYKCKLIKG